MLLTPVSSKAKVICLNLAWCWINVNDVSLSMANKVLVFVRFVRLLEVGRNLNKADTEGLKQCAYYFKQLDQVDQKLSLLRNMAFSVLNCLHLRGSISLLLSHVLQPKQSVARRVETVASKPTLSKSLMIWREQWLQRSSHYPKHSPQPQWLQNPQQ